MRKVLNWLRILLNYLKLFDLSLWWLCHLSTLLGWSTFPRFLLSYVFARVSHKKKNLGLFWRAAERQPPFCCWCSLLPTACLPHWHEAAAGLQFLYLALDPSFSFSESWVRCMICSEMNGPGFCKHSCCNPGQRQQEQTRFSVYLCGVPCHACGY